MPPAPSPAMPHSPARALFAQECTHDTHYMNYKGDLYTALITGGNRLLMLKNGRVLAQSGPLFAFPASPSPAGVPSSQGGAGERTSSDLFSADSSVGDLSRTGPCVFVVSICRFTDDVLRVAVATTAGVFVFEFDDAGLLWQDTKPCSFWRTADDDGEEDNGGSTTAASPKALGGSSNRYPAAHGRHPLFQPGGASPLGSTTTTTTTNTTTALSTNASNAPSPSSTTGTAGHLVKNSGMTGRLRWRRVAFSLEAAPARAPAAAPGTVRGAPPRPGTYRGSTLSTLSSASAGGGESRKVFAAPVRVAAPSRPSTVRAMDFVSEDTICVVLETEAVLIALGDCAARGTSNASGTTTVAISTWTGTGASAPVAAASPQVIDRVVWRSLGAYRKLAVCRVNHHVALALGHSSMVVFPSRVRAADGSARRDCPRGGDDRFGQSMSISTATSSFFATNPASGPSTAAAAAVYGTASGESRSSSVVPTPAFSPTSHPSSVPTLPSGIAASRFPSLPGLHGGQASPAPASIALASRGLTASVGIYHIADMRWHRVSSHTLLCVTCTHPREEAAFMMLYTVQSLSTTRRYTNVMEEHADGGWGLCRGGYEGDGVADGSGANGGSVGGGIRASENIVQLVPAGVIALTYTPTAPSAGLSLGGSTEDTACVSAEQGLGSFPNGAAAAASALEPATLPPLQSATPDLSALPAGAAANTTWGGAVPPPVTEMHTDLVPNFSRSAEANSMSSRMEFVHVEGDGTVRTSSYAFGRQKHASFAKQRAVGLACTELLQPLLHLYGSLVRVTVLPTWRTRQIELGHHTGKQPQAVEVLLSAARRYRMILRFTSGVVLSVMVDLSAALYRVEAFFAIGSAPLLSLRPIPPLPVATTTTGDDDGHNQRTAVGTTAVLLVGLLGFPTLSAPPPGKPKRLLTSAPSFLEAGEPDLRGGTGLPRCGVDGDRSQLPSRSPSVSPSASPASGPCAASPASPPRTVWGVVLLQVEPSGLHARVLSVAPLSDVSVADLSEGAADEYPAAAGESSAASASVATDHSTTTSATTSPPAPRAVSEEDVKAYMEQQCPEKAKFLPALLKATQGDAGRLLTQLVAKYGPLEASSVASEVTATPAAPAQVRGETEHPGKCVVGTEAAVPASLSSPTVVAGGCVSVDGDVLLLLTADRCSTAAAAAPGGECAAAAVIRIRPPCIEAFAPVHRLVAVGSFHVPFVPVAAEYVWVPPMVRKRWMTCEPLSPPPTSSPFSSCAPSPSLLDAASVRAAFFVCQRTASLLAVSDSVHCEVVRGTATAPPHIRVRSALLPDSSAGGGVPTELQYLPLPSEARAGKAGASAAGAAAVQSVKGTVLVNNDVVVGVLCMSPDTGNTAAEAFHGGAAAHSAASSVASAAGTLYLYGCPAVQSLAAPAASSARLLLADEDTSARSHMPTSAFALEATLAGVEAFYLSTSGELVVLRRAESKPAGSAPPSGVSMRSDRTSNPAGPDSSFGGLDRQRETRFERWLRCFPGGGGSNSDSTQRDDSHRNGTYASPAQSDNGYSYVQDPTWSPPCSSSRQQSSGAANDVTAVTTVEVAGAWEANAVGVSAAAKLASSRTATRPVLYATAESSFIHVRQLPLRSGGDSDRRGICQGRRGAAVAPAEMPQYHPDAVMQLIGMARWSVLAKVLRLVLAAAKASLHTSGPALPASPSQDTGASGSLNLLFSQPADELARRLCTSTVARGFRDRPQVVQYDDVLSRVTPPRLSAEALQEDLECITPTAGKGSTGGSATPHRLYDLTAACGDLFAELTQVLPQVILTGLQSQEQLSLLCILQALRDTLPLSRSVDEAAARYLFFTRLMSLGRRLRLPNIDVSAATANTAACTIPGVPINSVLFFEVGRTATRTVATAAYLWAAMSDSQSTLVSLLFDKTSAVYLDAGGATGAASAAAVGKGEITWEQVEQSGAAFWLRSAADLRSMADRVARQQYQATKELTACALMYCTAHKVGTLAALAKAQNNARLHAFFSRDFAHDERHRAAASANAYAAISKNMPQYGAAFFLLAGDVRSAVQVLLQRCHSPSLALFVLRAAGEGMDGDGSTALAEGKDNSSESTVAETPLQWYVKQRASEEESCGPLDMWETACLSWMDVSPHAPPEVGIQRRIHALQRIARHPTAHPEVLCALRYARDGVAALAYRGDQFLSPAHEVVCLLRLGRYCVAHRLHLNGYLHYRDAEKLLDGLRAEVDARDGLGGAGALLGPGGALARRRPPPPPRMAADFNTGTLAFRGFDSDDDDDGPGSGGGDHRPALGKGTGGASGAAAGQGGSAEEEAFVLSPSAEAAVRAELQYAFSRTGVVRGGDRGPDKQATPPPAVSYEEVLRRMLLCFTSASSFMSISSVTSVAGAEAAFIAGPSGAASGSSLSSSGSRGPFQQLLTSMLRQLIADMSSGTAEMDVAATTPLSGGAGDHAAETDVSISVERSSTDRSAGATLSALSGDRLRLLNGSIREPAKCAAEGWYSLCIPLLHLLLGKVALQEANYLVLLTLQRIPVSTEGVLAAAEQAGLLEELFHCHSSAAAASQSPAELSPLYLPLVAFFRLLGRFMIRFYQKACDTSEGGPPGVGVHGRRGSVAAAAAFAGAVMMNDTEGGADAAAAKNEDDADPVHQNMFDALTAAAAAAEATNGGGAGSGASSPGVAGSRRWASCFDDDDDLAGDGINGADDDEQPRRSGDKGGSSGALSAALPDSAQVALLLACCQAQLQIRLTEHLRHLAQAELQAAVQTPTTQRARDAGILYAEPLSPAAQAMLLQRRILLCTMLLDVTAQWGGLAEETMMRLYTAMPRHAPGPLTDPNGVFLEVQLVVLRMRAVLVGVLAAPPSVAHAAASAASESERRSRRDAAERPSETTPADAAAQRPASPVSCAGALAVSTTWLEENTVMLLDLCQTQLELFWALPSHGLTQCHQLAAPTRAALRLLSRSTACHGPASQLLQSMLRPVSESPPLAERSHTAPTPEVQRSASPNPLITRAATSWWPTTRSEDTSLPPTGRVEEGTGSGTTGTGEEKLYCPALSFLQLAWLRRHHTHTLLRGLLLAVTLDTGRESGHRPLTTDRLILTQHSHSATGVQFDASSCDSVVCSTEAGTSVGHGFRELLAGDNEEALWRQSTERNLATAAFTLGLTAQQERLRLATEHAEGHHSPDVVAALAAKSVLESRPRCGVAANAMPSSHPHLPFFLSRHRDGHIDLYPFASQECVASFCCAIRHGQGGPGGGSGAGGGGGASARAGLGSVAAIAGAGMTGFAAPSSSPSLATHRMERHAITPVAFSPNGYIIAAGLSDGSVAGWRFAAAAVENAPAFLFPQLFAPYGIRACAFCGDRSSLLVVAGLAREPHSHQTGRGAAAGGRATGSAIARPATATLPTSSFAFPLPGSSPSPSASTAAEPSRGSSAASASAATNDTGELVGELLVLDTMLDAGAVAARCALPFVPSYAVYLTALRAVLVVSSEGHVATYALPTGRLAVLGTLPVGGVLSSLLEGSVVGDLAPSGSGGRGASSTAGSGACNADGEGVRITCVTRSIYDPLVAFGTSKGLVLLLHLRHISAGMREAERRIDEDGEDVFLYYPPAAADANADRSSSKAAANRKYALPASTPVSASSRMATELSAPRMGTEYMERLPCTSVLLEATCMQVAPQVHSRFAVEDVVFSPSMLLAGLRDGKVMAAAVIAQAIRTRLTAGCTVPHQLLEVPAESAS